MRKDKGQAVLFDALIFLAIASVVSASLIGVMSHRPGVDRKEVQIRLDRTHFALLRATINLSNSTDGKNLTVLDHMVANVQGMAERGLKADQAFLAEVKDILESLLPSFEFRWSVRCGPTTFYAESDDAWYRSSTDRYASHFSFPASLVGGKIELTLSAWPKA